MSLIKLIENQTIIIDDHNRGNQEVKTWDNPARDVHIDKTTNFKLGGVRQKVRIKIPLNSQREVTISDLRNKRVDEIPRKLKREIQEALENRQSRIEFVVDVLRNINNYQSALENREKLNQIFTSLSSHFELNWTGERIETYTGEALELYSEKYRDQMNKLYFITMDQSKLKIGRLNGYGRYQIHNKKRFK